MGRQYAFKIALTSEYTLGFCESHVAVPTLPLSAQFRRAKSPHTCAPKNVNALSHWLVAHPSTPPRRTHWILRV